MLIFISVCYCCFVIIGFFWRYRFSKFTTSDYYNNKSLNRKRIYFNIYSNFVAIFSFYMCLLVIEKRIPSILVFLFAIALCLYFMHTTIDLDSSTKSRKKKRK